MTITIRTVEPGKTLKDFIEFPEALYRGDPGWVSPLRMEVRKRLSPDKNPFFDHADVALFTAWSDGRMVGRCSAQIDHEHLRVYGDETGFFGFFDTVDDPAVAQALLKAAEDWCAARGMRQMRGPYSLGINEEIGVMSEGFDARSVMLTPYHRPYQAGLIEACGFSQVKEIINWRYLCHDLAPRAQKGYDIIKDLPEVRIRQIDKSRLDDEMAIVRSVFNDAWSDNWGYVPWTDAEFAKAVEEFRMILEPRLALITEVDGVPMGIAICLPNLNEAIAGFDGRLGPINLLKLVWRIKRNHCVTAKLPLMGIRKEIQRKRRYGGLAIAMCVRIAMALDELKFEEVELGWTLEDNFPINAVITRMGATPYKRHRIYQKAL
ncbi:MULTISPECIES: hypothetical protein [unclassified Iodidimonas]|jgi:hypothetical protein|uniref:hypothetical protein n=1 Tax=unclassified Iodidimonas TaxID=2626145 RepID=UPI0024827E49|nr:MULTISPECIES: hypothetical protein [unclassified Iodidimonas]